MLTIEEIGAFDEIKDIFTHNDATHAPITIVTCKIFITVGMGVDPIVRIDVSVFVEADKATGWAVGDTVSFYMLGFSYPVPLGSCGIIGKTDIIHGAALSTDNIKGEIFSRGMEEISDIILGIGDKLVSHAWLPHGKSLGGRKRFRSGREAQDKAEQRDRELLKQSNLLYPLMVLRQCSGMQNFALNGHF